MFKWVYVNNVIIPPTLALLKMYHAEVA